LCRGIALPLVGGSSLPNGLEVPRLSLDIVFRLLGPSFQGIELETLHTSVDADHPVERLKASAMGPP
jgi:hypothetical protein